MSRLFVSTYLDEDVNVLIATLLRARAWAAQTTLEAGRIGSSDSAQLAYAAEQQMAPLTHNRVHFENLAREYTAAGQTHSGIIIAVRRSPYEITRRLLGVLNATTADELDNQVIYV